jgi:hypothetical protein
MKINQFNSNHIILFHDENFQFFQLVSFLIDILVLRIVEDHN